MSLQLLNQTQARKEFYSALDIALYTEAVAALCILTNSNGAVESYAFADAAPAPKKFEGSRRVKRSGANRVQISNDEWDNSIGLPIKDLRRDQTGTVRMRIGELALRMAALKFKLLTTMITDNTAKGYDNVVLFSTSHSIGSSGTQKNILTASEVNSLDIASASAPTPEEMVTAIMDSIGYMRSYKDDEGEYINENARSFLALVPTNMDGAGQAAVHANNLTSGKTNIIDVVNRNGFNIQIVATPRLATGASFYLARTDGIGRKPFILQEEVPASVRFLDENSEYAAEHKEVLAICDWEGGAGVAEPLTIAKCTFS